MSSWAMQEKRVGSLLRINGRKRSVAALNVQIKCIFRAVQDLSGDREKTIGAGCDDYDTKPVEFDRLVGKIERLLGAAKY
jgi:two-component system cell cycle response regulator DivK